ncbi:DUF2630 family protein [Streptomyces sp. NPDC001351]|uniref:DUF2630 family protein n=1 Tax=Streptomyces sp. NPDC001351 TaxID=3364564 RepID=UPI0036A8723F
MSSGYFPRRRIPCGPESGHPGGAPAGGGSACWNAKLDQCSDLLRQRRAEAEFGENPDDAQVRPSSQVEGAQG